MSNKQSVLSLVLALTFLSAGIFFFVRNSSHIARIDMRSQTAAVDNSGYTLQDTYNPTSNSALGIGSFYNPIDHYVAGSFVAHASYTLTRVELPLSKNGSPTGTLVANIYSDNGGHPGTPLGTGSQFVNETSISSTVTFSSMNVPVVSGSIYWIVVSTSRGNGDGVNYVGWNYQADNGTAVNTAHRSSDGVSWEDIGQSYGNIGIYHLSYSTYSGGSVVQDDPVSPPSSNACVAGGNCYIRQGATGNNSGSDWTNAYTSIPVTLQRGATYYVADGSYGYQTFDDPVSGTQLITIKKATGADHGTNTGWSTDYGDGQAIFDGLNFLSQYWVFDGQVGSFKSMHGFDVAPSVPRQSTQYPGNAQYGVNAIAISSSHITVNHTSVHFPDRDDERYMQAAVTYGGASIGIEVKPLEVEGSPALEDLNFVDVYLYEIPGVPLRFVGYTSTSDILIDGMVMNGMHSDANRHASGIVTHGPSWNGTIRNSWFEDLEGTGGITFYGTVVNHDWKIYNNIFYHSTTRSGGTGMGSIAANDFEGATFNNFTVVNNTFIGLNGSSKWGFIWASSGTNNLVENNLWYDTTSFHIGGSGMTIDYNYFSKILTPFFFEPGLHNTPVYAVYTNDPATNGNHSVEVSNPFLNSAAADFRLRTPLTAYPGIALPAPYNVDREGNVRGADGLWDVGAFEYCQSGTSCNTPPSVTPPTTDIIPPTTISPDFNHDGLVNSIDLSLLVSYWNQNNATHDLNNDNTVNSLDYGILVQNWSI